MLMLSLFSRLFPKKELVRFVSFKDAGDCLVGHLGKGVLSPRLRLRADVVMEIQRHVLRNATPAELGKVMARAQQLLAARPSATYCARVNRAEVLQWFVLLAAVDVMNIPDVSGLASCAPKELHLASEVVRFIPTA